MSLAAVESENKTSLKASRVSPGPRKSAGVRRRSPAHKVRFSPVAGPCIAPRGPISASPACPRKAPLHDALCQTTSVVDLDSYQPLFPPSHSLRQLSKRLVAIISLVTWLIARPGAAVEPLATAGVEEEEEEDTETTATATADDTTMTETTGMIDGVTVPGLAIETVEDRTETETAGAIGPDLETGHTAADAASEIVAIVMTSTLGVLGTTVAEAQGATRRRGTGMARLIRSLRYSCPLPFCLPLTR